MDVLFSFPKQSFKSNSWTYFEVNLQWSCRLFEIFRIYIHLIKNCKIWNWNRGPQIWNLLPDCLKQAPSFKIFNREIKKWKVETYPCDICKTYIQQLEYIWIYNYLRMHDRLDNIVVWLYVLIMSRTEGTPCLKQVRYLKFKRLQRDSNPQPLSS